MESMFSSNRPGWAALLDEKVTAYLPDLKYVHDEPLARHTSFRIGGPATRMAFPTSGEQIVLLTGFAQECGVTPFLLGNGTNLLVADEGLDTLVIQTGEGLNRIALDGGIITADAGVSLARLGVFAWQHSLTGLEFAHGIPGSLGGGVVMNAGAYGTELAQIVSSVDCVSLHNGKPIHYSADKLDFSYRHSALMDTDVVVTQATLALAPGDPEAIRARMEACARARREKQPLNLPSAGSTFKRPEGHFAAKLIDDCGLRGLTVGGAQVSEKHAGFVVNVGGATARDMLELMRQIEQRVFEQTGVQLEPEVRILGTDEQKKEESI